jgi:DNA modification methylase
MKPLNTNNIVLRPIDELKPNPENARTHSEDQLTQIARSFDQFGITLPILIDETGMILAGHGKWLAAKKLNLPEVPVLLVAGLTETEKRLYLIADNQIALNSTWDQDKLRAAVEQLEKQLADLDLTGFSPQEIDRIVADLAPEEGWTEEDDAPGVSPIAISRPGALWSLDQHRLFCGDATLPESYERLLQGQLADLVFCDFPYNVNYSQKRAVGPVRVRKIANDNLGEHFEAFLHAACVQLLAVTRGPLYLCMSSSELHTLYNAFTAAGGHWSTFLIWAKDRFTLGRSDYQRQFEVISYGWKEGEKHFWCGARNEGDLWSIPRPKVNRLHPTSKPVALVERAIRNSSHRGDLVLDAMAGSGSTLIACEKTKRRAALMELDPIYVDVIIRRWEAYTHREAHLENDGRSFGALATERARIAA